MGDFENKLDNAKDIPEKRLDEMAIEMGTETGAVLVNEGDEKKRLFENLGGRTVEILNDGSRIDAETGEIVIPGDPSED